MIDLKPVTDNWSLWTEQIQQLPSAAYAARKDDGFTLLAANQSFYRLLDCTPHELQTRYGGRLGALLETTELGYLPSPPTQEPLGPFSCKQRVTRKGCEGWLQTDFFIYPDAEGDVLCCVSVDITQCEKTVRALTSFEEAIRVAAGHVGLDYFSYDLDSGQATVRSALSVLPAELAEENGVCPRLVERMVETGAVCPEYAHILEQAFREVDGQNGRTICELQMQHAQRGKIWVRLTLALIADSRRAAGLVEDITREKEAVRSYLNETQFYQAMLAEKTAYAQVDVTEERITRIGGMWNLYNEIIDTVTYSQLIEEFINKVVHPEDRKHYLEVMQAQNFIQSLENGIDRLGCEFRRIVDQNKMMWMELNVSLFRDPLTHHVLALLTIKNIDAKKKQELLLLRDSRVDQLTNVYNRKMAEELIRDYLNTAQPEELCAFVVLDVDNFKQVNDSFGHEVGDEVLVRISGVLSQAFRRSDIIGRFGGDEFILFLKAVGSQARLSQRMEALYTLLRHDPQGALFCSAGVALAQGAVDYDELFRLADNALYQAKREGKNRFVLCPQPVDGAAASVARQQQEEGQGGRPAALPFFRAPAVAQSPKAGESFESFLAQQGDIAYLVDPNTFDLLCGNQALYDRLGMNVAQCAGLKCYEVMHKRTTPCPFCSKANWATDKFYLWRNQNQALEQEFLIKNKLVPWQGRTVLLAIAVDISNDKSIVDSMDNQAMEGHSILGGVQRMAEATTLALALESGLESIGCFFRAEATRFWQYDPDTQNYRQTHCWCRSGCCEAPGKESIISRWLNSRSWEHSLVVESPEAMLGFSYDMYQYMKDHGIRNQRWMLVQDDAEAVGIISIENLTSNFQNVAFLESFSTFLASELKKRRLVENALYADRYDDLTGLLGRKSFEAYVSAYHSDQATSLGVLTANFNNLKSVNSQRGFQIGNHLLKLFANMLSSVFGPQNAYRLNGDEFLVVLVDLPHNALEARAARLARLVAESGDFSVAVGYAWDDVERNLGLLIEEATQAMEVNKQRYYDSAPMQEDTQRRKMLGELVAAIEAGEFEVFLQPKVELLHGTVVGAEALIRYHHKEHGYLAPSYFIDILEKNDIIRYIDLFVFEEVCRQLAKWRQAGLDCPVVSLNFSRLTLLERDILDSMEAIISQYDVPRKLVEIEITESVVGMGKSMLFQAAYDLYQAGFAISLDDFGTKYTNLSVLADLDFSILKVDRSLVGELGHQRSYQLIMKNIVSMCQDLGIHVLAEGIETEMQEQILQGMDCPLGQGYLYGRPIPMAEFDQKYVQRGRWN